MSVDQLQQAPKVLLHDHLDGGLRPQTIIELAGDCGYDALPETDAQALGAWFRDSADSGRCRATSRPSTTPSPSCRPARDSSGWPASAPRTSPPTASSMPRPLRPRAAPEKGLTSKGSSRPSTPASRRRGEGGRGRYRRSGSTALLTAMRHAAKSTEIAELAIRYRDDGVSGFDIAGAEAGYPPTRHLDAFEYLQRENIHFTIHAGEAFGLPSIWQAIQWCGADRLGHGVRIVDDITIDGSPCEWLGQQGPRGRAHRLDLTGCVSAGSPPMSGTSASRWRCARAATCRPPPLRRSRSTPSPCCVGCGSASRSTPTTASWRHVDEP